MNEFKEIGILVVDDVQVHRFLMTSGIGRINPFARIEQASSVAEAVTLLEQGRFHAVVCDWNMPGNGGNELVKWMRARPSFRRVPFIMISGSSGNEDIIHAFMEFGIDAYVVKPFTPRDLYRKIIAAIEKRSKEIKLS